jgi:methylenetetrahydrofolate dehydrogenase (NADP+) / methenyltetrahydrofolate cyclohydrolase
MDGKALAARIREDVRRQVAELGEVRLATVLVGDDPASQVYIGHKHRAADEVGIEAVDRRLPAGTSEEEVLAVVRELNADESIDGLLVQTPIAGESDERRVTSAVDPRKDVDGLTPVNAGLLFQGRPALVPATALGIMALLAEYRVPLEGARAVVVGRSLIVGKPVSVLLQQANATVTMCHSLTQELERHLADADVIVSAVGVPGIVAPDMVRLGSTVIDVGITRTDAGLVGDVDPGAAERAAFLTPVPGGVGPLTIAMVLANTLQAARYRRGLLAFPGP